MISREQEPGTGTRSGFHFYDLYEKCRRKFFIMYVKGIESAYAKIPLELGSAFHYGKEVFYNEKSKEKALEACIEKIKEHRDFYYDEESYAKVLNRTPIMLESWIDTYGFSDLETYDIFAVEEYIEAVLPGTGNVMSMRLDAILQHKKSKATYIMETKTTQSSMDNMKISVRLGDQATVYTYGFKQRFPNMHLVGVVPDITFWSKNTVNPKLIKHWRGFQDIVYRSRRDLEEWELGMNSTISEISQKVEAYNNGMSEFVLFRRNTYWCNAYYRPCEFASICRGCDLGDIRSKDFVEIVRNRSVTEEVAEC